VNWAEFAFGTGDRHGVIDEKVSFYNVWQNPRDQAVLVDDLVRLTANGWAEASAGGLGTSVLFGWASEYGRSRVDVSADLRLWGLWQDPAPDRSRRQRSPRKLQRLWRRLRRHRCCDNRHVGWHPRPTPLPLPSARQDSPYRLGPQF
jgi:hypothetical protein